MSESKRPKVVRLSEIKTNAIRRKRKEMAEEVGRLKGAIHDHDSIGYVVVLWNRDGTEAAYWNTEALGVQGPIRGELAKRVLDRIATTRDVERMLYDEEGGE